jgi:hypothetical protein
MNSTPSRVTITHIGGVLDATPRQCRLWSPDEKDMLMQYDSLLKVAKESFKNRRQPGYTDVSQETPPSQEEFNTAPAGNTGPFPFQPVSPSVPAASAPPPSAAAPPAVPAKRSRQKDPPASSPAAVDTRDMSGDADFEDAKDVPDVSHPETEKLSLQQKSVVPGPSTGHVSRKVASAGSKASKTSRTIACSAN